MHCRIPFFAILSVCALTPALRAETVFEQDPLLGPGEPTFANTSFWDAAEATAPGTNGHSTTGLYQSSYADNFWLNQTATVTTISWTGYIESYDPFDDSNISGFEIQFFQPQFPDFNFDYDSDIYTQSVSLADAHPVVVESPNGVGTNTYTFTATLSTPQTFLAGQQYFVGINADIIDPNDASYFWSAAADNPNDPLPDRIAIDGHTATNGYSYAVAWNGIFADPSTGYAGETGFHDLAFTLSNDVDTGNSGATATPLPRALWGGLALIGIIAGMKFRRTRVA